MKKLLVLLLAIMLLTGCAAKDTSMTISVANLNEDEAAIAKLLDANFNQHIYDFVADDTLKSVNIRAYELVNGEWEDCIGSARMAVDGKEGRFVLDFDVLPDALRVAFQCGDAFTASTQKAAEPLDVSGMSRMSCRVDARSSFEYEEEIPLFAQVISSKNETRSFSPDAIFPDPSVIAADGHEHVYVVTVTFSQQPLE